jgi:hypothetical protein
MMLLNIILTVTNKKFVDYFQFDVALKVGCCKTQVCTFSGGARGDQQGPWPPLCHGMLGKKLWLSKILTGFLVKISLFGPP